MLVYKHMKHLLLTAIIFFSIPNFSEESEKELVNIGEIWTLGSSSGNTMSIGGEVPVSYTHLTLPTILLV